MNEDRKMRDEERRTGRRPCSLAKTNVAIKKMLAAITKV